jgi:hypothetical protein
MTSTSTLAGKRALVTGGSRGIGDAPALCRTPLVAARKSHRSPQIRLKRRPPPPAPTPADETVQNPN